MSYSHSKKFTPGRILPRIRASGGPTKPAEDTMGGGSLTGLKVMKIPCLGEKKAGSIHPDSAAAKPTAKSRQKKKVELTVSDIVATQIPGSESHGAGLSQANEALANIRRILLDSKKTNKKRKTRDVINF